MSFSQSTSYPVTSPFDQGLAQFLQQIASISAGIGQQVFSWGQGVYNNLQHVTDANIGRYLDQANAAGGLAQNIMQQYENVAAPEYNALVNMANQYAGTPFIKQQMGEAEAQQQQAGDAARQNAIRDLQSYGIDPSAGRYAALDEAQRTAEGAAAAAAGTQSALATKAQGQQLLTSAVQAGQQLPGAAVNATNSALQGISGAENSILGAANTGANLYQAAAPYFGAAMGLKYPPQGQQSQSTSGSALQGGAGKDPFPPAGKGNPSPWPQPSDNSGQGGSSAPGPKGQMISVPGAGGGRGGGNSAQIQDAGAGGGQDPFASNYPDLGPSQNNPFQDQGGGLPGNPFSGDTQFGSGTPADQSNPFSDQGFGQNPFGDMGTQPVDTSGIPTDTSGASANWSTPDQGQSAPWQDPNADQSPIDTGGGGSYDSGGGGGGYDASSDFAQGGAIPGNATTGGHVPQSASPSQGQQTDDIHANLNAGEFVVPKDIAEWKGQEFFHKLIADSRMKRQQMQSATGVGGQMKPQAQGPVTFRSQAMR